MSSEDEKKLEELLQLIENLPVSLFEMKRLEDKYIGSIRKILVSEKISERSKELLKKIRERTSIIFNDFIDKLAKEEIELNQEEEAMIKSMKSLISIAFEKGFPDDEQYRAGKNLKKAIDWKLGVQSNQPTYPNKKEYPWGIIVGMGAVIAALSGTIIFLLIRNKNKKKL